MTVSSPWHTQKKGTREAPTDQDTRLLSSYKVVSVYHRGALKNTISLLKVILIWKSFTKRLNCKQGRHDTRETVTARLGETKRLGLQSPITRWRKYCPKYWLRRLSGASWPSSGFLPTPDKITLSSTLLWIKKKNALPSNVCNIHYFGKQKLCSGF